MSVSSLASSLCSKLNSIQVQGLEWECLSLNPGYHLLCDLSEVFSIFASIPSSAR